MFCLSKQQLVNSGLSPTLASSINQFNFDTIEADLIWLAQSPNHHLLTWETPSYPSLLEEIPDPPIVLYGQGKLSCLEQMPRIAIVGSRSPSPIGKQIAWRFAYELAQNELTVVSGLALGIDAKAHEGCLASTGKTIAVLGTGIDQIYPQRHRQLADKICENGLLVTEFPLKSTPKTGHFPRRNRIISGLSLATLVVEAAIRSGSLITAQLALEQNREVLAIPGSIYNPQSRGCHHLLQQGARLVTSSQDILDELGLTSIKTTQSKNTQSLESNNGTLAQYIGFEMTTVDEIVARSGLSIDKITCDLATLELKGVIKAVPGGYMRYMNER